jgi:(E)-4-hydroxy-3-methylbut-2-enyl-diphosphate synthase
VKDGVALPPITAFLGCFAGEVVAPRPEQSDSSKDCVNFEPVPLGAEDRVLRASVVIGSLLADGIGDAFSFAANPAADNRCGWPYNILQAAGCRSFKTDYVACPSCGRTLFNLQT